jgi:hypothetical protein
VTRARLALLAGLTGCLGPQVSDEPAASGDIVPAGTAIPSIDDDEDAAVIAANDGVDGIVPRLTAFADGVQVHYWDFGPAPKVAAPVYILVRAQPDGTYARVAEHPPIIGTIPGEPGYSPYWSQFALIVTAAYAGELLTSSTAIEEAVRAGLIEKPLLQPVALDCPVVASDIRLDVGTGTPLAPAAQWFYEHKTVSLYCFGQTPLPDQVDMPIGAHYVLRRAGGEPLSEPVRGVDIDGDGDTLDSNDIFDSAALTRTPLVRTITVAVAPGTASIDTSGNDATADLKAAAQLFDPDPVAGTVVGFEATDELHDMPLQRSAGGL